MAEKVKDIKEIIGSRVPPYSKEAEMAVLCAMLLDKNAISLASENLESKHFYNDNNSLIFETILSLYERRITIDAITITDELKKREIFDKIGGEDYLAELMSATPTTANIEFHTRIILEKFFKRCLIKISGEILEESYKESTDALDEIDKAEQEIFKLASMRYRRSFQNINKLAHEVLNQIQILKDSNNSEISGVPSGFIDIDKMTNGFQNSDLIIIAARPSMGKTALSLSIARNVAMTYKKPVAYFSIEMAANQLMFRLLSGETKINQQKIRTGYLDDSEMKDIVRALGNLAEIPLIIDDSPGLKILELKSKCRRLKSEENIAMVMIDYLQLIKVNAESREREIALISRSLKEMAKELDIPVVAMAQLNRGVEARTDKTPMLSDLRESGSIEQDADVVMFINRPEYYGIKTFPGETMSTEGIGEIIIGKQRNGATGTVRLAFLKEYARFENLSMLSEEPNNNYLEGSKTKSYLEESNTKGYLEGTAESGAPQYAGYEEAPF